MEKEITVRKVRTKLPKEDSPPLAERSDLHSEAEERLIAYVDEQIEKMQNYTTFDINTATTGFYELTKGLRDWHPIYCSLVALDVQAKLEYQNAKDAYEDWEDEHFQEAKDKLSFSLPKSAKLSQAEIEHYMRYTWHEEFKLLRENLSCAEMKVAFIRRMLDGWEKQQLVISRVCRNIESEMSKLGGSILNTNTVSDEY